MVPSLYTWLCPLALLFTDMWARLSDRQLIPRIVTPELLLLPSSQLLLSRHSHLLPIFSISAKVLLFDWHNCWSKIIGLDTDSSFSHTLHATHQQSLLGLPSGHILDGPLLSTSTMASRSKDSRIHLVYLLLLLPSFSLCSEIEFWKYKSVYVMLLF